MKSISNITILLALVLLVLHPTSTAVAITACFSITNLIHRREVQSRFKRQAATLNDVHTEEMNMLKNHIAEMQTSINTLQLQAGMRGVNKHV